jgi:aminoglycoside phosphotransferase (APT) family kinase protein
MNKDENADTRVAEGYDIPAVEAWIAENTDYFAPPFSWTRLEGGHSNLTYRLEDPTGKKAVIRRPPMCPSPSDSVRICRLPAHSSM